MKPRDWPLVKLRSLGRIVTGRTPPSSRPDCFGMTYPFITPSDMDGRRTIATTERGISDVGAELLARSLLPPGSVAVSCIGWQMGKVVLTAKPSFSNQQLNTIIPSEKVDAGFLYYCLSTRREDLKRLASVGTRTPILNKSAFGEIEVQLPPFEIQCRVAHTLSAYDDLIQNNARRIAILAGMAKAIYHEWFVNFRFPGHEQVKTVESEIGMVPAGWEVRRLGEAVVLSYGKALKKDHRQPGSVPVYGSSGVIGFHDQPLVEGPGIIVGRKGNVGTIFWSENGFYPIDTTYFVETDLDMPYVYFNLQRQHFLNSDAAVPGLSRSQAYSLPFLLPSTEVMRRFSSIVRPIMDQQQCIRRTSETLRKTRDLLLPKLISGKIDVSEFPAPEAAVA